MTDPQKHWDFAGPPHDPAESGREYQRELMAKKRAGERDIDIPPIDDPERRAGFADDPRAFLLHYGHEIFYNDFTADQDTMIEAIADRIRYGGYQAIAAARGDGKSSITKWMAIWAIAYGRTKFLVIIAANARMATRLLSDIKYQCEFNSRLHADFPELTAPVRALEGAAQRARSQTANGERTRLEWQHDHIVFAHLDGSHSAGAVIIAVGLDGTIRGLVRGEKRPDMVIIDDPQTRESAASRLETDNRRATVRQDVLGLAGPGKTAATLMLCTVIRCDDLADEFTDRQRTPAWGGIKQRFIVDAPDNDDLWSEYITMRQSDQIAGDGTGRNAHTFYLAHREAMDDGAVVNNPYRFNPAQHDDGSQLEVSALEHAYNLISDMTREAFDAEYQNDPHSLTGESIGVNDRAVCQKINGVPRGELPPNVQRISVHIDVHGRRLDWIKVGWSAGLTGAIIDYGETPVHSPAGSLTADDNIEHTRAAIYRALLTLRDQLDASNPPDCVTVDSGWQPGPVYRFCKESGPRYHPTKGCGSGLGEKFRLPTGRMAPSRRGSKWFMSQPPGQRIWLIKYDADHYKNATHTGFMTPADAPGSIDLFGEAAGIHREFARQICAEVWVRNFRPGKGWQEGFDVVHHHNHKLDCMAGCMLGAELCRIKPAEQSSDNQAAKTKPARKQRISFAERRARGG